MATMSTSRSARTSKREQLSALAVAAVTAVALILGALLKSSVENRSQHVVRKGISAAVPANWIVEDGVSDLIFTTWDPFVPDIRYTVFLESNRGSQPLQEVAAERNLGLGKALDLFRVLEETPIIRRGLEGYKVTYAFIDTNPSGPPLVLRGVDYYFPQGTNVVVIGLQAHEQDYDESLLRFEAFLDSVSYRTGG